MATSLVRYGQVEVVGEKIYIIYEYVAIIIL